MPAICTILALAHAAEVRFDGERWSLLSPDEPAREAAPVPQLLPGRAVLDATSETWRVDATWPVFAVGHGYLVVPVVGRDATIDQVTLDGEPLPVERVGDRWVVGMELEERGELRVSSFLPAGTAELTLAAAAEVEVRGDVVVDGPRLGPGRWWVGGAAAAIRPAPPSRSRDRTLVIGETAVGLTVRDASLAARARLRFRVARGAVSTVSFDLDSQPADLEVVSDQVTRVDALGSTLLLTLAHPEDGLVEVEATWSADLPPGSDAQVRVDLPILRDTFRSTTALQLARDTDREVIPEVRGLDGVLAAALPDWGRGLVDGAPTAAWLGGEVESAGLQLLKTSLVDQPPTVIEVAQSEMATSAEGRLILSSRLAVRNDRSAFLGVTAPAGTRLVSARVKGQTALVTPLGDGRYLVPLARSVQSVQGSLSFPVELAFLGTSAAWGSETTLLLPSYDAPVAVHRTTLHLPPGYRAARAQDRRIVERFTEGGGIDYGFEPGDARVGQAEALLDQAVTAWLDNDFETSQGYVDQLDAIGADNADVGRLRSNLAVVTDEEGEEKPAAPEEVDRAATRRLKALAWARSEKDLIDQKKQIDEAERYLAEGDYGNARRSYETALEIGDRLERIAAEEDVSQQVQNQDVRERLAEIVTPIAGAFAPVDDDEPPKLSKYKAAPAPSPPPPPPPPPLDVRATTASVIVPDLGEVVHHQRLLIAAGDAQSVTVRARPPRRKR